MTYKRHVGKTTMSSTSWLYFKNALFTPLSLTISKLAKILRGSRKAVSAIVNGRKSVTPEMALRLSRVFPNTTPESWFTLQRNYDLWQSAHASSDWKLVQTVEESVSISTF